MPDKSSLVSLSLQYIMQPETTNQLIVFGISMLPTIYSQVFDSRNKEKHSITYQICIAAIYTLTPHSHNQGRFSFLGASL